MTEIKKIYDFNLTPPIAMLKSGRSWKKIFQHHHWVQREAGEKFGEEIYEIFVFVPYILSETIEQLK